MSDAERDTPRSSVGPEPQPLKRPKDRTCPFCGQLFTSSSLGRHLDLFIRPENPKAPDGKHDVDEIRKIRGNITRRNFKGVVKRDPSGGASNTSRKPSLTVAKASVDADGSGKAGGQTPGTKSQDTARDRSRKVKKAELNERQRAEDDEDTVKAAELALKELLRSVREASAKAAGLHLFDFDPYELNFPSLCLHILPAPTTLFSPTPFPTSDSWTLQPPGQKQFEALKRQVQEKLLAHNRRRQNNDSSPQASKIKLPSANSSPLPTPPLLEPDPQRLFRHLTDAYNHWSAHSDKQRQEAWQLEILRSYAKADRQRQDAEASLLKARQEIEELKAQLASPNPCDSAPVRFSFDCQTIKELRKLGADFRNWDYDRLIDKWKGVVRDEKMSSSGMAAQKPLPKAETIETKTCAPVKSIANAAGLRVEIPPNPYASAPTTTNGTEVDSDHHIDAEGEDEDADADADADIDLDGGLSEEDSSIHHTNPDILLQPSPHHTQVHTPQVHTPHVVGHDPFAQASAQFQAQEFQAQAQAQAHAHAQAHAQAQAQAQVQAWAAARQHMNQSRNQHRHVHQQLSPHPHGQLSPHPLQQLSPHPSHMGSGANSRRGSYAFLDGHSMPQTSMPMELDHQNQFLRLGIGLTDAFVGSTGEQV